MAGRAERGRTWALAAAVGVALAGCGDDHGPTSAVTTAATQVVQQEPPTAPPQPTPSTEPTPPSEPPTAPNPTSAAPPATAPTLASTLAPLCLAELYAAFDDSRYNASAPACLADVTDWTASVAPIERAFTAALAATTPPMPGRVRCASLEAWVDLEREVGPSLGAVRDGSTTIELAPGTCLALEWLVPHPLLPCVVGDPPYCGAGSSAAARSLVVVAHEAQHVGGVRDETAAECGALERVADLAVALGMPPEQAAAIAPYVRGTGQALC